MRHLSLLIFLICAGPVLAESPDCLPEEVAIVSPDGSERARYSVKIADDPEERSRGLMFVEHLPADEGMLFLFEHAGEVGFWMKNTLIPLDLIFIEETGRVSRVHNDAVPHDETPIRSGGPVSGVLEINAGEADLRLISVGDAVTSPFIGGADDPVLDEHPAERPLSLRAKMPDSSRVLLSLQGYVRLKSHSSTFCDLRKNKSFLS